MSSYCQASDTQQSKKLSSLQLYPTAHGFAIMDNQVDLAAFSQKVNDALEFSVLTRKNDLLYEQEDKLADTKENKLTYVVDQQQNIYVCKNNCEDFQLVIASQMLGWPICAGKIKISSGLVSYLDNDSIVFKPQDRHFQFVVSLLENYSQDPLLLNQVSKGKEKIKRLIKASPSQRRIKLNKILLEKK